MLRSIWKFLTCGSFGSYHNTLAAEQAKLIKDHERMARTFKAGEQYIQKARISALRKTLQEVGSNDRINTLVEMYDANPGAFMEALTTFLSQRQVTMYGISLTPRALRQLRHEVRRLGYEIEDLQK